MEYGLIGKPLGHSFSAEIHPKLFDCEYTLKEIDREELDDFFAKRDFKGINVTIPYKSEVIKYLDFIDENAKKIGTVNTVVNRNGKLFGYNTDFSGLKTLISSNGVSLEGKNVLILGSGGTSRTARAVAQDMGAANITAFSRKEAVGFDTYENIGKYYDTAQIIINTTPVGMYPEIFESVISLDSFKRLRAVFDVVYNPIRTKLVCDALKKGIIAEGGMKMLVFQALFAARLFSGLDIPDKEGEKIVRKMLKSKENIVLIGMPASGKSTIGKRIAKSLGRVFIDTDTEIKKTFGRSPKEIITTSGEAVFREYETKVIKELAIAQRLVIATGGGAVENEINMDLLRENGKLVFLNRSIDFLSADSSRPLSSTREKLEKLYEKRMPLYKKYADLTVYSEGTAFETANSVLEMIL